jgi:CheY-like chemotaxis protein
MPWPPKRKETSMVNSPLTPALCSATASEMLLILILMNMAINFCGKNILLVEDDEAVRESIKLLLGIDRHTVTEAASGHEALQLFTGSRYDLVITDYLMPEMLGDELAQNIKTIAPRQPILMVTAYLEKLVDAGKPADAVLGKPFSVEALRQAIAGPIQGTTSRDAAASSLSGGLSRSDLVIRASANTHVLREILGRKRPVGAG